MDLGSIISTALEEIPQYIYKPLSSPKHIRLFHLSRSQIADENKVSGELVEVSLDQARKIGYDALSYTWGPRDDSARLYIGNTQSRISESLLQALKSLAAENTLWTGSSIVDACLRPFRRFLMGTPRALWIDAICINQNDPKEKAKQIPLMTEIYRRATYVPIWLGQEDEHTRVAFECISASFTELQRITGSRRTSAYDKGVLINTALSKRNMAAGINSLFEKEWFARLWVIQEAVLAKFPYFLCGSLHLHFVSLAYFALALVESRLAIELHLSKKSIQGFWSFMALNRIIPRYQDGKPQDLLDLVLEVKDRGCTDARDRIFGLYGIATGADMLPYEPTYEKSEVEIYTDFAYHNIVKSGGLRILAHSYLTSERMTGLSSWVPDWPTCLDSSFSEFRKPCPYSASGQESRKYHAPVYHRQSMPAALILKGIMVDKIKFILSAPDRPATEGTKDNKLQAALEQVLLTCSARSDYPIPWPVLWRTIICDLQIFQDLDNSEKAGPADELGVAILIDSLLESTDLKLEILGQALLDDIHKLALQQTMAEMYSKLIKAGKVLEMTFENRSFCITDSGRCGWIPDVGLVGDEVVIIAGHVVPLILRRCEGGSYGVAVREKFQGDSYRVVGEGYIHGIMHGEAVIEGTVECFNPIRLI